MGGTWQILPSTSCVGFKDVIKLSVGVTSHFYLLEIDGLFTQRWRPVRTFGEAVGGILVMESSDWSNVIRHHTLDTGSDTEFKHKCFESRGDDMAGTIRQALPGGTGSTAGAPCWTRTSSHRRWTWHPMRTRWPRGPSPRAWKLSLATS